MDLLDTLQQATGTTPSAQPSASPGAAAFDPTKSYGTPAAMLNKLTNQESSGGKNLVNPTTGAMGPYQFTPGTLAMLRNQGVKFDPFDPAQSRAAADWYIQKLKAQNGGTYQGALKAYGGFQNADPSQYIDHVMNGVPGFSGGPAPTTPGQTSSGQQAPADTGPQSDLLATLQTAAQNAQAAATPAAKAAPLQTSATHQKLNQGLGLDPISSAVDAAAVRGLSGLAGSVAGLGAGAAKAVTTMGDFSAANQAWENTAGKVSNAIEGALTPAGSAGAQQLGQAVADVPGRIIGGAVNAGSNAIGSGAQALGASPQTAQKISNLAKFGANAALTIGGTRAMLRGTPEPAQPAPAAESTAAGGPQPEAAAPAAGISPEAAAKPRYVANGDGTFTQVSPGMQTPPASPDAGVPMAAANLPAVSGKAIDLFPSPDKSPTVSGPLPQADQAARLDVVRALGLDRVRDSVLSGDPQQAGVEYQNAKVSSPIGDVTRATIADEQNAIRNYADGVNDMTGRDPMLDAEGVGTKILAPLQKMSDWFDNQAGNLYQQAREQAGNVPLAETPALTNLLGDLDLRDRMSASPDRQALYNAVQNRFARFSDLAEQTPAEQGAAPRTIENAENFRQWLNAVGRDNPQSGQFISQVKQALDTDVGAAGGQGLFDQARSMWQQRQQMLADPGQISKLLGDQDGTGLNRNVPMEKVGQRVVGMDGANFRNLLGSLTKIEQMAPELAPDVQGSLAEIRGQAARQLTDAGGKTEYWNANQFSKTAQSMAPKLKLIFNGNEMGALRTLNEAGRIIRQPGSYPGAAAQHINMLRSGIATALPYAANAVGHAVGGTVGGFAGQIAGNRLSSLARAGGESKSAAALAKRYSKNVNP
ncbi:transglycosylase SLT domain-containing protein [Paraburkholderia sp. CNPSo 3274]|uniref:transglycosylase SLT domain-containing protein n=1 Tax=Paraburkholderia sp. CNPSo 3274 TaxID=2940932 RepID=UPI0020B6C526|nr:transglycosylase SLT domain-containing protein [Paraburkholderia sp. CNPSo 3274]MCP3709722.1 transglycosylase SLT domain-containing protein [Paraburkholderia sp. CNPSo 3274]